MHFPAVDGKTLSIGLLMAASVLLYGASRMAVFALARPDGSNPGRRALAQWVPIAATAIAAILWRSEDAQMQRHMASIAISVVFGTSLACLSLVAGMATYLTPLHILPPSKKVWPFVLPVALLTLMAGISGHLTWWHALMLMALGGAIVAVWLDAPEGPEGPSENPPSGSTAAWAMFAVVAMCAVGAILIVKGTLTSSDMSSHGSRMLSPGVLAATILSPLLVLPTLGTASSVAQRGYPGRALTALVGTVLLNLCVLLPIIIFCWYFRQLGKFAGSIDFKAGWDAIHALPYDMAAWRIETVLLIVLGFAMIPVSMGRWVVGKLESTLLVFGYAVYVVVLAVYELLPL